jgi:hypothetical protein
MGSLPLVRKEHEHGGLPTNRLYLPFVLCFFLLGAQAPSSYHSVVDCSRSKGTTRLRQKPIRHVSFSLLTEDRGYLNSARVSNSITSASPHTDNHRTINNIVINHNQQSSIMSSTHSSPSPLCTQTEVTANWERLRKSCDSCQEAKVKCSQHKPSCHRCLRHRQPCNREKGRHSTGIHIPRSIRGAA